MPTATVWVALTKIYYNGGLAYNAGDIIPDANNTLYGYGTAGLATQATIQLPSGITTTGVDMATQAELDALVYRGSTAPSVTTGIWVDTSATPEVVKYYNGTAWTGLGGSAASPVSQTGSGVTVSSVAIEKPGVYLPAGWGANFYPARNAHKTARCDVIVFGDSTTFGQTTTGDPQTSPNNYSWVTNKLRSLILTAGYTDGGNGLVGGYLTRALSGPDDYDPVITDGNTIGLGTAWATGDQFNPNWSNNFKTTTLNRPVSVSGYGTNATIYFTAEGGFGSFTYSVNGATAVTVNAATGGLVQAITVTGLPAGLNTITFQLTVAGACQFVVDFYNNTGITLYNSGISGQSLATRFDAFNSPLGVPANNWAFGIGYSGGAVAFQQPWTGPRAPKLAMLCLSLNDSQAAATNAAITSAITACTAGVGQFAAYCRTAGCDGAVLLQHYDYGANRANAGAIRAAMAAAAKAHGLAVIDLGYFMDPQTNAGTYGGAVHLNQAGYDLWANSVWNNLFHINPPTDLTPSTLKPQARLSVPQLTTTLPFTVTADASASAARSGTVASYTFDFGDGTVVTQAGATLAHTYTTTGPFNPKVTVTDSNGKTNFATVYGIQANVLTGTVKDTFTRADANSLGSVEVGGLTWQDAGGAGAGNWRIVSNQASFPGGPNVVAWIDRAAANKTVTLDITSFTATGAGILLAYTDANNYCAVMKDGGDHKFKVWSKVGGTTTFPSVTAATYPTLAAGTLTASISAGNVVTLALNGTTLITYTLSAGEITAYGSATNKCGLFTQSTTAKFDNFSVS